MKKLIEFCVILLFITMTLSGCTNKNQVSSTNTAAKSNSTDKSVSQNKTYDNLTAKPDDTKKSLLSNSINNIPSFTLNSKIYVLDKNSKSFKNVTPKIIKKGINIFDVYFTSKDIGIAVCAGEDEHSFILRTKDGGKSWDKLNTGRTTFGAQINFINNSVGFILLHEDAAMMHENVAILKTIDEGFTWNVISQGYDDKVKSGNITLEGQKKGIGFISENAGWISGYKGPIQNQVFLLFTKDGGKTFEDKTTTLPSEFKSLEASCETPIFFSDNFGLLPVKLFSKPVSYAFYTNKNGTEDWKYSFSIKNIKSENLLFSFYNNKCGYATDGISLYFIKRDTGIAKTIKTDMDYKDIKKIIFINKKTGWIITSNHVYKTTNGGKTWK